MSISELPVRDPAAEVCRTFWTDLSEVFRDDHSTVPGLHLLLQMLSCLCKFSFHCLMPCFLFAELSQAIQRDRSCYGDGVTVETRWSKHNSRLLAL